MTKRTLFVYPNCSSGGMSTVLRGRARVEPDRQFDFLFHRDAGGRHILAGSRNVALHHVEKGRILATAEYLARTQNYDEISITSMPELANAVSLVGVAPVTYEFHTSDENVISKELATLSTDNVTRIVVPSRYSAQQVGSIQPALAGLIRIRPNLVGTDPSDASTGGIVAADFGDRLPLLWVGRLDRGKSPNDFARVLSTLGSHVVGVMVLSLEDKPDRISTFLGYAASLGVADRLTLLMDVSPSALSALYRAVAAAGGAYVSTSLMESFGYAIAEASSFGVPVVAYDVGAVGEHEAAGTSRRLALVDVGDLDAMAEKIRDVLGAVLGDA